MGYEPRSIAFITDLIHPPVQHKNDTLHAIYNDIFKERGMGYQNFNLIQGGAQISNPPVKGRVVSTALFLPDRLRIQEELPQFTLEEFFRKVKNVVESFHKHVKVPTFSLQQVVIRSLITPKSFRDSRVFLGEAICGLKGEYLKAFGRASNLFGVRFVFPQTQTEKNMFNVRVESYSADTRSIFIENAGVFFKPIQKESLEKIEENIQETYKYLNDNICTFLESFDQ